MGDWICKGDVWEIGDAGECVGKWKMQRRCMRELRTGLGEEAIEKVVGENIESTGADRVARGESGHRERYKLYRFTPFFPNHPNRR